MQVSDIETIQGILLYEQSEAEEICIKVQPPMIREYAYYYIPTDRLSKL